MNEIELFGHKLKPHLHIDNSYRFYGKEYGISCYISKEAYQIELFSRKFNIFGRSKISLDDAKEDFIKNYKEVLDFRGKIL